MSRGIEATERFGQEGFKIPLILIDLQMPFSGKEIRELDNLVKAVFRRDRYLYQTKYTVGGDTLYISQHGHTEVSPIAEREQGKLLSAGFMGFIYMGDLVMRRVSEYSQTLDEMKKLTKEASDEYKLTVLRSKLVPYFEFE